MNTPATSIRVFTHQDVPNTPAIVAQAGELAATHGMRIEFIAVDSDTSRAFAAGVLGLPAIIAFNGSTEVARREAACAGRSTRRWFERKVAAATVSPALTPAMA